MEELRTLKLYEMLTALELQMKSPDYKYLTFEERFGLVMYREITDRENRRLNFISIRKISSTSLYTWHRLPSPKGLG